MFCDNNKTSQIEMPSSTAHAISLSIILEWFIAAPKGQQRIQGEKYGNKHELVNMKDHTRAREHVFEEASDTT